MTLVTPQTGPEGRLVFTTASSMILILRSAANFSIPFTTMPRAKEGILGEMAAYPQEINGQIVSPFVHTVLHTIVDSQLRTGQPECVEKTFKRLRDQDMEEHEVLHAIIAVYADLHFSSFRQGKPFDQLDYESRVMPLS